MPNTSLVTRGWKGIALIHHFFFLVFLYWLLFVVLLLLYSCCSTFMKSRAHGTELPVVWNYKEFALISIPGFQY
jgi:hypothetical protein